MDGRRTFIRIRSLIPSTLLEPHEIEAPFEIEVPRNVFRTLGVGLLVTVRGTMEIIAKRKKDRFGKYFEFQYFRHKANSIQSLNEAI